ncbi:adenylate/guanylate cyclase domain-containing protein [Aquibium sp. LZ166]|uniref:Adenylate/guanylate cyclase domain-containing protein n=1 Tax=Aquibium pacificus TaxID=3153579 RepID=A0ABV3SPB6_9HYPH
MQDLSLREVNDWVTQAGLNGTSEPELLAGFCQRLGAAGVPVARANVAMETLHPVHEGRLFFWDPEAPAGGEVIEVSHVEDRGALHGQWLRSPFHHLHVSGERMLRRRLSPAGPEDFDVLADLRGEGYTDYLVQLQRFAPAGAIGEMDCVNASWATRSPTGFSDRDIEALTALFPGFALALKSVSLQRIAATLLETYLGRDAGRRVLQGRIERGETEHVRAVIWFSDLRSFTRLTDTAPPDHIIPFLNGYAEAVISSIHEAGGDVLKLIGDGTLAIFDARDEAAACRRALDAVSRARRRVAELNRTRRSDGLFATEAYVGLHLGEVFYGNIGSTDRLDFTVIGPAVNMASRISAMCRSAERDVLISADFVRHLADLPPEVVSVGRYALRGFDRPQELFTIVPEEPIESNSSLPSALPA